MIKKPLSLKDAMSSLHIVETDEGIELQSAAGTAKYDAWGVRCKVNGIPEYFPSSISVNNRPPDPADDKTRNSHAFIASGVIHAAAIETPQPVTIIYNINFGVRNDKPVQNKVTISADKFEIKSGIDASSAVAAMDDLEKAIRKAIHNECLVGGIIQRRFSRY
ncbi:TPA: hypothetical protein M6A10_003640 [Citrobacter amalonaticus]|nr:hypothetical protein [Citrobacter amalonaticus]HCC6295773.1 hypothetical protein [Citrobacter amalonaticus]HCC6432023.1 hypothetical protein [Citrobacter amalonaticus]HCC7018067.1 hypothetical protein [Citrobacter amalonaticus]